MNMDRLRPPKDCRDIELWLSGVINDAIRGAIDAGCSPQTALRIVRILGRDENRTFIDGGVSTWFTDAVKVAARSMFSIEAERSNLALVQRGIRAFLRVASEHGYRLCAEESKKPVEIKMP